MTTSMRATLTICIAFLLALIAACVLALPGVGAIGKFGAQTAWAETGGVPDGEGALSDEYVASVTTNGVVEYYTDSGKAIAAWRTVDASDSKTLTLLSDIKWDAMNNISIPLSSSDASQYPGAARTLDLNGFVFESTRSIDLEAGIKLVVKDGSASGEGKLLADTNAIRCYKGNEVVVESGAVLSETSSVIYVDGSNCSVAVNGGVILSTGGRAITVDDESSNVSITVNAGKLSAVRSGNKSFEAIWALDGTTVAINGGTITSEESDAVVARSLTVTGDPIIAGSVRYDDNTEKIDLLGYTGLGLSIDFQSAFKYEGSSTDKVQIPQGYVFQGAQEDVLFKVGDTIAADSIVSVEPYHVHDWEYTAEGNRLTATCKGKRVCPEGGVITIELNVPASSPYDGMDRVPDVSVSQVIASTQKPTNYFKVDKKNVAFHACAPNGQPQSRVDEIIDAGMYTASLDLSSTTGMGDYQGRIEAPIKITPRVITIIEATVEDKVCDGTTKATVGSVTLSGLAQADVLMPGVDYAATAEFLDANAGIDKDAVVTVSLKDTALASNYVFLNNEFKTKAQITPAPEDPTKDDFGDTAPPAGDSGGTDGSNTGDDALASTGDGVLTQLVTVAFIAIASVAVAFCVRRFVLV